MPWNTLPSNLDASQIIQAVYTDPSNGGDNRLRVDSAATIIAGSIDCVINDTTDSIKIGGGGPGPYLIINPDGSINTKVTFGASPTSITKSNFNEILAVASGVETNILTYTVPAVTSAYLQTISTAGSNIAQYKIYKNAVLIDKKYTMFGMSLDIDFDYRNNSIFDEGFKFNAGDIITINVLHNRPYVGDFNARIQVIETI